MNYTKMSCLVQGRHAPSSSAPGNTMGGLSPYAWWGWSHRAARRPWGGRAAWLAHPPPPPIPPSAHDLPLGGHPCIGVRESPMPSSRFVHQPVDAVLHEALDPFVYKASADADCGRNVGDWHAIGQLQMDPYLPRNAS